MGLDDEAADRTGRDVNVLVICREIPPVGGGAGSVALELATELADHGHHVYILTMHFGDLPIIEKRDSVTIQRIRCGRRHQDSAYFGSMLRFVIRARRIARRLARSEPFDLVHAHAIVPDGVVAEHVARRVGIPIVITAHGSDVPGYDSGRYQVFHRVLRPFWKHIVKRANLLTTPSYFLRRLILESDPAAKVTVIPNGIDLALLAGDAKDRKGFLIVSRLIERKNYHRFFEALALIDESQEVHVVGEGPELPRLRGLTSGTTHHVTFHGWLAHGSNEWRRLYERSRFFVFPSVNENFPINLLEAQLAGLTILASPIPGNREVLGAHAVYFGDLTPEGIAATIQEVLGRPDTDWDEMGGLAMERVSLRFSWTAVAARFAEEYAGLMEANGDN